jgi:chemotaxis response regulator CheB
MIGDGADTTLICAALAKQPDVRVVDVVPHARQALKLLQNLLQTQSAPMALAIAGAAALRTPADELLKTLEVRGIPVVGIAAGLSQEVKQRALAAGVKEIHDRPRDWQAYSELIEAVIWRFTQADRRGASDVPIRLRVVNQPSREREDDD